MLAEVMCKCYHSLVSVFCRVNSIKVSMTTVLEALGQVRARNLLLLVGGGRLLYA